MHVHPESKQSSIFSVMFAAMDLNMLHLWTTSVVPMNITIVKQKQKDLGD